MMQTKLLSTIFFLTTTGILFAQNTMTVDEASHRVGINNTHPQYTLDIRHDGLGPNNGGHNCLAISNSESAGDIWQFFVSQGDGTLNLFRTGHPEVKFVRGDGMQTLSDSTYKTQIADMKPGQLARILSLQPRQYRFKSEPNGKLHNGFVAQEVNTVYPELVSYDNTGHGTWMLNYGGMVPFIVKAMQEQQAILDQKDAEILRLKARLAEHEEHVARLEAARSDSDRRLRQLEAAVNSLIPSSVNPGETGSGKK